MQLKPMQKASMRTLAKAIDQFLDELRADDEFRFYFDQCFPVQRHKLQALSFMLEADLRMSEEQEKHLYDELRQRGVNK